MVERFPVHGDRLLLLVVHWLSEVSPPLEYNLLYYYIHLGPAEQISNKQSVDLVDTESGLNTRPEEVETNDGDKKNMGPGLNTKPEGVERNKKKNKSFLTRLFRRKWFCLSLSLRVEFWLDKQ